MAEQKGWKRRHLVARTSCYGAKMLIHSIAHGGTNYAWMNCTSVRMSCLPMSRSISVHTYAECTAAHTAPGEKHLVKMQTTDKVHTINISGTLYICMYMYAFFLLLQCLLAMWDGCGWAPIAFFNAKKKDCWIIHFALRSNVIASLFFVPLFAALCAELAGHSLNRKIG